MERSDASRVWRRSELSINMVNHIRIHIPRSESNRAEHDQPQLDLPAACIIAQQYSSAAFSLRLRPSRKEFGVILRTLLFQMFKLYKNYLPLKLRKFSCFYISWLTILAEMDKLHVQYRNHNAVMRFIN